MASLERSIWRWEEAFRGDDNRFKFLKDWVCKTSKVGHMCLSRLKASLVAQTLKKSACEAGDLGSVPGSGRSPGKVNGNPLQYSCLENPMDRGAWQATVHEVTKSQIQLSE